MPVSIRLRATGFDLPALTLVTQLQRYAAQRAVVGGDRAISEANRRRFLSYGSQNKFILGTLRPAQSKPTKPQDALQVGEQCRVGGAAPGAAAPEPRPTVAAPVPAPKRPAPTKPARFPRRKGQHPRRLRRRRKRGCNNHLHREARQHWRRVSSRTKRRRKHAVRLIPSFGSTCLRRSITSRGRGVTGQQSVALTCVRRKPLRLKTGLRRQSLILRRD